MSGPIQNDVVELILKPSTCLKQADYYKGSYWLEALFLPISNQSNKCQWFKDKFCFTMCYPDVTAP